MNEINYNLAMFGKEYLDKAIDGIQTLAPKVWWYLQWKCWIDAIIFGIIMLCIIGYFIFIYKITRIKDKDVYHKTTFEQWNNDSDGFSSFIFVILGLVGIIGFIGCTYELIIALTPICPIDKAVDIGAKLIGN